MVKVKTKRFRKTRMVSICMLLILSFSLLMKSFNKYVEPQLIAIGKQHAGFAINNIVKEVLTHIDYDTSTLWRIDKNKEGEIISVFYDSNQLNKLLYTSLQTIDQSLLAAQDGKKDPTTKDVFYEDGIVYELPIGYLTHIFFLYDRGPKLHVRMHMLNDVTGEIKTELKPYGINSTMIQISLVVRVHAQVITFLSRNDIKNTSEIPIVVQIVNGKVPTITPYQPLS